MKLLLIRHAQSVDGLDKRSQRNSSPLSDAGKTHAQGEEQTLAAYSFTSVYSSSYMRAQETATILFPSYKVKLLKFIYEIKRPLFLEGGEHSNAVRFWEVEHKKDKYDPTWSYDGSESFNDVVIRANKLLDYLYKNHQENDTIAIISHGGYIRHFIANAGLKDLYTPPIFFDLFLLFQIPNVGIIEVDLMDKKLVGWKQK